MDKSIKSPKIVASVVSGGERPLLERTLTALVNQSSGEIRIRVTDISGLGRGNQTAPLQEMFSTVEFLEPMPMAGMAAAHNRALALALEEGSAEYALILEAGVMPAPRYIEVAAAAFGMSPRIGQISCLLTGLSNGEEGETPSVIISGGTGISTERRTYDLFEGTPAGEVTPRVSMVFGAHQACAIYRLSMLKELSCGEGEIFDEDFIGPKAGVDLSWRSQIMGWNAVLVPSCCAFLAPGTNLAAPFDLGAYRKLSYRNRYLMILKNDFLGNVASRFARIAASEAGINFYSILFEPSLIFGLPFQAGIVKSTLAKRAKTMRHKRRGRVEMEKILALKK